MSWRYHPKNEGQVQVVQYILFKVDRLVRFNLYSFRYF